MREKTLGPQVVVPLGSLQCLVEERWCGGMRGEGMCVMSEEVWGPTCMSLFFSASVLRATMGEPGKIDQVEELRTIR